MLQTVKDACELHPMALDYAMSEQIENLSDVIERTEKQAGEFFEKNHITRGMELLLSQGLKRLGRPFRSGGIRAQAGDGRRQDAFDDCPGPPGQGP